ncbi:MAG TPA: NfeD family protein [Beijerinckiaceae bacterium]|nr:NfeD family protein [Beijerinckiaceae bacterium]
MMGSLGSWGWLALGLLLIALEVLVIPGGFLLWIGIAALVMGAIVALVAISWQLELVVFGLLALAASFLAWKLHHGRDRATDAAETLHDRSSQLIGRRFALEEAIVDGFGRVRIDDTLWRVSGPALDKGAQVRVTGVDGATLVVSAAEV